MRTKIKNAVTAPLTTLGLPMLALAWVSIAWGTTWLASKEGVKHMPALQLAAIRQFLGGALYVGFFLVKKTTWPKGKQWKSILILSMLNFALSVLLIVEVGKSQNHQIITNKTKYRL